MRATAAALALLATALLVAAAAAGPGRTFRPAGTKVSLGLPRSWHATAPDPGWTFEAVGPRSSGWVFLSAVRAVVADPSFQRSLVAFERKQTRKLSRHVVFTTRQTTVDGESAVEVFASGAGTTAEYVYGFQHGGLEYILVFATTTDDLQRLEPVFTASLGTLRFLV